MNDTSVKRYWRERATQNLDAFLGVLRLDPFDRWERNRLPEAAAESYLINGLKLCYGGNSELAGRFFSVCIEIVDRSIRESVFERPPASMGFPMNRGIALRARSYASGLTSRGWELQTLTQASVDFHRWSTDSRSRPWDAITEAYFLAAIRVAVVTGDLERAATLCATKKRFSAHGKELALMRALVADGPKATNRSLKDYFDTVRDPDLKPRDFLEREIVAFELGILSSRDSLSSNEPNWQEVIAAVAA